MAIEELRDLIIVISGATTVVVLILVTVILFMLYHKMSSVLNSVDAISKKARDISAYVSEEMVKPSVQVAALIQCAHRVTNFLKRK